MTAGSLERLADDLARVAFVPGTEVVEEHGELLDRARRLLAVKLRFEAERSPDAPPLVVIAGGTNVGKSTVFNWVVGDVVASSSPLARHTKAPTVYVHRSELSALRNGSFLSTYERLELADPKDPTREPDAEAVAYFLLPHERDEVRGVVLVDSPDIDSTHARNRAVAEDLLFLADALLFVSTPEKYNDELCVRYLRRASELDKTLTCVLNKGADAEVARDFREVVVPGVGGAVEVLTLPWVTPRPDPRAETAYRTQLREAVLRPRQGAVALRSAALRGARARLGQDLERVASRLREERLELDRIRSEVALALDARSDAYRGFLSGLEFYELDRVFERVLDYFKIPVLDHVYDGFRSAVGFLSSGVAKLVTGKEAGDSKRSKLRARAERDRLQVKELLEAARAEVLDLPERHAASLRQAVPGWLEGLAGPSIDALNEEVEGFITEVEALTEEWVERETQRHVTMLEAHPYARNALRAVKGTFQVGFGLLSAKLTGGFGPWDVLIGTATERATKKILESAGGYVHYQGLKAEFAKSRAALFRQLLERSVAAPLLERLPPGVDPERLERLGETAAVLARGEQP